MPLEDSKELKTLRYMEWERAKGSLNAILASYWTTGQQDFQELKDLVGNFIDEFGGKGGLD